jgi:diaminohydroxyphosphoribosylaminopyrimidine deaminase/5-amino-6-(5-phosphoribosylamino)uracil reductase
MNRYYLHAMQKRKPFVVGKFAASLDGRTATRTGHSQWITGEEARKHGHRIRQSVDAILVGAQTVVADNPRLTVRLDQQTLSAPVRHPLRLVLDSTGRVPPDQRVFDPDLPGKTEVFTTRRMSQQHQTTLEKKGVRVHRVSEDAAGRVSLDAVMNELTEQNLQSLLIEGGQQMLGSFHDKQLINEYLVFIAPLVIGGATATPSVGGHGIEKLTDASSLRFISCEKLSGDIVLRAQRKEYRS